MISSGVAAGRALYDLLLLLGRCCVQSGSDRCVCAGSLVLARCLLLADTFLLDGVSTGNHAFFFAGRFSNFTRGRAILTCVALPTTTKNLRTITPDRGLVNISPWQGLWRPSSQAPCSLPKSLNDVPRAEELNQVMVESAVVGLTFVLLSCSPRHSKKTVHRGYYVSSSKYAARAVFTAKVHD